MNLPTQKSIDFAKKSAKKIGDIDIKAQPKFYFDTNSKSSNSIDKKFLTSLEKGEHLNDDFLSV